MYDFLIVGAGLFGSVFAREARKKKYKCLVIDKRNHIGGNCYTENIEGTDVYVYGPHIFNTNNKQIWNYVNQLSNFIPYIHKSKIFHSGDFYSLPINLMTLHQIWKIKSPKQALSKINTFKEKYKNPENFEEYIISQIGEEVYYKIFYDYTKKQWNREPRELPISIAQRIPIRLTFDDNYYNSLYQGIPANGYTKIFEQLLKGIDIELNVDFSLENHFSLAKKIVYTGELDALHNYVYGNLEYRSLKFKTRTLNLENFQGSSIINYSDLTIPYTRITEHKFFNLNNSLKTTISVEYPCDYTNRNSQIPYYPINNKKNNDLYEKYKELTTYHKNIIIGGRLAEYKYMNMDSVIESALNCSIRELT